MQLLVYTDNITPRKEYIFEVLFDFILGTPYTITSNANEFLDYEGPKISYCDKPLSNEVHFKETALLSEKTINHSELSFIKYEDYEVPFPVSSSFFPFDVFAASFYLISRYEEYLDAPKDSFGRFEAKNSLAYKKGFLNKPVIDEWAIKILNGLKAKYPSIKYKKREFTFQPTLDIDTAYYLKTEKFLRRILRIGKQILKGNLKILIKDPFDVYNEIFKWDTESNTKTIFFMLMNSKHAFDGRENKKHPLFTKLIKRLNRDFILGLHPSYSSNENEADLLEEKSTLEALTRNDTFISRQHYLKISLPDTYKNLLETGIKEDYTMLYADFPGFRASTCSAFLWYNLSQEKKTNLLIQPAAVMDQTLRKYMHLSQENAIMEIQKLILNVKNVNGVFVSLWHNESISDFGVWKGWKKVYIEMLKMSKM